MEDLMLQTLRKVLPSQRKALLYNSYFHNNSFAWLHGILVLWYRTRLVRPNSVVALMVLVDQSFFTKGHLRNEGNLSLLISIYATLILTKFWWIVTKERLPAAAPLFLPFHRKTRNRLPTAFRYWPRTEHRTKDLSGEYEVNCSRVSIVNLNSL